MIEIGAMAKYFISLFAEFEDNTLFEVYDLETQKFIKFPGNQGTYRMNRSSVVDGLVNMTCAIGPVENLIVLEYTGFEVDFTNPVFIGSKDAFRLT